MSKSSLRSTASALRRTTSSLYRTTGNHARKHSRVSVIAASAAAAGVLSAGGFAASAAPWSPAANNAAKTAPSASGQSSTNLFKAITGAKTLDGKSSTGGQLDTIRSAATAGGTGANATAGDAAVQHQATAAFAQQAQQQAVAKLQAAARQQAAAKRLAAQRLAAQRQAAKAAKAKAHAAPAKPYVIYDSVRPDTIPSGKAAAVYANGAYAAFPSQVRGHGSVLWIDTNGSDPGANVLDVEPGDATPVGAAQWVKQRLSSQPHSVAIVYTMMSDWQQVKDNVAALPGWMQSKVRYWIADPTGVPHVIPGSSATQWYWGNSYDVTTANPNFVN
jgi:hypothetical protein